MTLPTIETIASFFVILSAIFGALVAAFWLSLVIWAFRDMRLRSRDPFAQILAALLVAIIPFIGVFIYMILRPPETLTEKYERALEEEAILQEIEERPRCPKCARLTEKEWAMCPACHTELKTQCQACFSLLELSWSRCPHCTTTVPAKRPPLTAEGLLRRLNRPIPSPDMQIEAQAIRRRVRTSAINRPIAGKVVVGGDHPTIAELPTVHDGSAESPMQRYQRAAFEGHDEGTYLSESK